LGSLHALWKEHRDAVDFLVVYIREAHPEDGWVVTMNRDEDIRLRDPETDEERLEVATSCALRLAIEMPVVVDAIDDTVARAYGALPDRLYLIGRGGHVAFQGEPGPFGFDPKALEVAIHEERARIGI
jgi:hypothetical protein